MLLAGPLSRLSGHYFFAFFALGVFAPYLPLMLKGRGLSAENIGTLMMIAPAATVVVPAWWGRMADRFSARARLLMLSTGCSGLAIWLLLPSQSLWSAFLALVCFCSFSAAIASLSDALTHSHLKTAHDRFARIRMWGSVGYALAAYSAGKLQVSKQPILLLGLVSVGYILAALLVPRQEPKVVHGKHETISLGIFQWSWIVLFAANAAHYFSHAANDYFFGLHLRSLGLGDSSLGEIVAAGVGAEIVVLALAPYIVARISSASIPFLVVFCGAVSLGRWMLLPQLSEHWMLVLLQTSHGLSFGLWYVSMVKLVQGWVPEAVRAQAQAAALSSVGFGAVCGALLGGYVFERQAGQGLYLLCAVVAGLGMGLYLVLGWLPKPHLAR